MCDLHRRLSSDNTVNIMHVYIASFDYEIPACGNKIDLSIQTAFQLEFHAQGGKCETYLWSSNMKMRITMGTQKSVHKLKYK